MNKKQRKTNDIKSWFSEDKIDKPLARVIRKKKGEGYKLPYQE